MRKLWEHRSPGMTEVWRNGKRYYGWPVEFNPGAPAGAIDAARRGTTPTVRTGQERGEQPQPPGTPKRRSK